MILCQSNHAWRFTVSKDGHTYRKAFIGTEREAKKAHEEFNVDIRRGNVGLNENMRFNELAQLVIDNYIKLKCSYNTYEQYLNCFNNYILDEFGTKKISTIKPLHIQKFINKLLEKKLSVNTILAIQKCLSKSLSLAVKWQLITKNPCENTDKPINKMGNT